jgi:hypothetical protein
MTDPVAPDRRAFPRASFTGVTLVHTPSHEIHCLAGNLSEAGMLLYPERPPETPRAMRVTFALPTVSRWIEISGTLVRVQQVQRRSAWGVRFGAVSEEVKRLLRHYVTTVAPPLARQRIVTPPPVRHQRPPAPLAVAGLPPPIPPDAESNASVTASAPPVEESTDKLPAEEAELLASSLKGEQGPVTRRTGIEEMRRLKERCRDPGDRN